MVAAGFATALGDLDWARCGHGDGIVVGARLRQFDLRQAESAQLQVPLHRGGYGIKVQRRLKDDHPHRPEGSFGRDGYAQLPQREPAIRQRRSARKLPFKTPFVQGRAVQPFTSTLNGRGTFFEVPGRNLPVCDRPGCCHTS